MVPSGPIWPHHFVGNRWGNSGKSVRLIFLGSKITADGDCSHEIKRRLLLGRKVMINLDSILKSRDITLPTKVCLVKAMVFLVVMYGCESWTVKKAECQRIDAFELRSWRRFLRVPWTTRRSNQSIQRKPGYSLEGLVLKFQFFCCLMRRADSLEKTLMLSRLVIGFLPRRKCLLILWLQSPPVVILKPPKIKSLTVSIVSPPICHEVMGLDATILVF